MCLTLIAVYVLVKFVTCYFPPFCNSGFAKVLAELCFSTRSPSLSRLWKYCCGSHRVQAAPFVVWVLLDFGGVVVVLLGLEYLTLAVLLVTLARYPF